jgi:hypothetical protein
MSRYIFYTVSLCLLLCHSAFAGDAKKIVLVCPERFPDVYCNQDGEIEGIQAYFVREALKRAGYEAELKIYPVRRCLLMIQQRDADGLFPLAYDEELTDVILFFPEQKNAGELEKARWKDQWRIMTVDHVVITHCSETKRNQEFKGDLAALPDPVRVVFNEPYIPDLKQAGKKLEDVPRDIQNFKKLMRDQKGTVIAPSFIAEAMYRKPGFKGKLYIHDKPLTATPTFLAFSKNSNNINETDMNAIWESLKSVTTDHVATNIAFAKATKSATYFLFADK